MVASRERSDFRPMGIREGIRHDDKSPIGGAMANSGQSADPDAFSPVGLPIATLRASHRPKALIAPYAPTPAARGTSDAMGRKPRSPSGMAATSGKMPRPAGASTDGG